MKQTIRLTESELKRLIRNSINESLNGNAKSPSECCVDDFINSIENGKYDNVL